MKKKDLIGLRSKSVKELETTVADLRAQLIRAKMDQSLRKTKNTNLAKNINKTIAQILTTKKEKELNTSH